MTRRVLVICAHPDDETLGCGGTLLKHRDAGDGLYWMIATVASEPNWSAAVIQDKSAEVARVAACYGMVETIRLGLPTVRMDAIPQVEVMEGIRCGLSEIRPDTVYLVHDGDVHSDHHAVFQATMGVLKAFYMRRFGVRKVMSFETLSSTEAAPPQPSRTFLPNIFHDITPYIDRKVEIMGLYATETQPDPLPRGPSAIRALARYRGATIGVDYAEALMLVRQVD